jgi:hypothetical protein
MYLDALFVELPCLYGLQYWVSDPQFTSTSFTFLVDRRGRDRFLSTIILIVHSVGQICFEGQQVLQVTLLGMCLKYRQIYSLVVCTAG